MRSNHLHTLSFLAFALASGALWLAISGTTMPEPSPLPTRPDDDCPAPTAPVEDARASAPERLEEVRSTATSTEQAQRAVVLCGRVIDAGSRPIAGATVRTSVRDQQNRCEQLATVVTATDGSFVALCPERARGLFVGLAVTHPEFSGTRTLLRVDQVSWEVAVEDITLQVGGIVRGSVTDALGGARAGAKTTLRSLTATRLDDKDPVAATDRSGGYLFSHVTPGRYLVEAKAAHCRRQCSEILTVVDRSAVVVAPMQLEGGGTLSGTVLSTDRQPVPHATVILRGKPPHHETIQSERTGADGRFAFGHAAVGRYSIEASAEGFRTSHDMGDVFVAAIGEIPVFVFLERGLRIVGRVTDAESGAPVHEFAARIRRTADSDDGATPDAQINGSEAASTWPSATAHPGGSFAFEGLDDGSYTVEIRSRDHVEVCSQAIEIHRGMPAVQVDLRLQRGFQVQGTVRARIDGSPMDRAVVQLRAVSNQPEGAVADSRNDTGPSGGKRIEKRTDADGAFVLGSAGRGEYVLRVEAVGCAPFVSEVFTLDQYVADFSIELEALGNVVGHVTNVPTEGSDAAWVVARRTGTSTARVAKVDQEGRYALHGLEPGSYTVRCLIVTAGNFEAIKATLSANPSPADPNSIARVDIAPSRTEHRDLAAPAQRSPR